jgi:hypothetical protein
VSAAPISRINAGVTALGGVFLLGSMYAPWYRAISTENFCGFLIEPYGGTSNSNASCGVGHGTVDMWAFSIPSLILLAIGLSALIMAHLAIWPVSARGVARIFAALVAAVAPGYASYRLAVPPGPADTFTSTYGAWLGLGSAALISLGTILTLLTWANLVRRHAASW